VFKKAGAVAAAAAGLAMLGSPAFAAPVFDGDQFAPTAAEDPFGSGEAEEHDQMGLLNFGNDADLLSDISGACNLDVNVIAVPILQGNDAEEGLQVCANSDNDDNDGASSVGDDD